MQSVRPRLMTTRKRKRRFNGKPQRKEIDQAQHTHAVPHRCEPQGVCLVT